MDRKNLLIFLTLQSSLGNNDLWVYTYNDSDIRTSKTVNGTKTTNYLNGCIIFAQITGSDCLDFFYEDNGLLLGYFKLRFVSGIIHDVRFSLGLLRMF